MHNIFNNLHRISPRIILLLFKILTISAICLKNQSITVESRHQKNTNPREPLKINGLWSIFAQFDAVLGRQSRTYRTLAKRGLQATENTWKINPAVREDLAV